MSMSIFINHPGHNDPYAPYHERKDFSEAADQLSNMLWACERDFNLIIGKIIKALDQEGDLPHTVDCPNYRGWPHLADAIAFGAVTPVENWAEYAHECLHGQNGFFEADSEEFDAGAPQEFVRGGPTWQHLVSMLAHDHAVLAVSIAHSLCHDDEEQEECVEGCEGCECGGTEYTLTNGTEERIGVAVAALYSPQRA